LKSIYSYGFKIDFKHAIAELFGWWLRKSPTEHTQQKTQRLSRSIDAVVRLTFQTIIVNQHLSDSSNHLLVESLHCFPCLPIHCLKYHSQPCSDPIATTTTTPHLLGRSLGILALAVPSRWVISKSIRCSTFLRLDGLDDVTSFTGFRHDLILISSRASHHHISILQDLTNSNVNFDSAKPGQNNLPQKRGARSDAYLPSRQNSFQQHQPYVVEQRNPVETSTAVVNPRQQIVGHMPVRQVTQPVQPVPVNSSSYQFGPADNIDERDAEDPLCVTAYVEDMYEFFRGKEILTSVRPVYMENQAHINERMRSILVDWLVEVHLKFKLVPETLYLTVNIIDRFLERQVVSRPKLQLVGVTSLLIAAKYEEIYPPELRDLVYICDRAYARTEVWFSICPANSFGLFFLFSNIPSLYYSKIIAMEETILRTLNYQITIPSAHAFLVRFLKAAHADKRIVQLSCYVLDGTLSSFPLLNYLPSQLAAAAVFIARRTIGRNSWSPTLLKYANYREEEIAPIARAVLAEKANTSPELRAVNKKYTSSRYGGVANIALNCDF
jgi:hypothetical protein